MRKQTSDTACCNGITDRGQLVPGQRPGINLVNFESLASMRLIVNDLPAGGSPLIQRADGYVATFVVGKKIMDNGEDAGVRPGGMVRMSAMS